jgi:hypothetical protein
MTKKLPEILETRFYKRSQDLQDHVQRVEPDENDGSSAHSQSLILSDG